MKKKYKIADEYKHRKRPAHLGPVDFRWICTICKKRMDHETCCEVRRVMGGNGD